MSALPVNRRAPGIGPGPMMRARLAGFAHTLRGAGLAIGHAEVQDAARILATPLAERPELLRAALKSLFCSRHSDLARFDELFQAFWRGTRREDGDAGHRPRPGGALAAQVRGGTGRRGPAIGLPGSDQRSLDGRRCGGGPRPQGRRVRA